MRKTLLKAIGPCLFLYRDNNSGIAWIENGSTGVSHSCHPNIHTSGSETGMKKKSWWDGKDKTVRSHGFIYNTSRLIITDHLDDMARMHCQCGGTH